MCTKRITIPIKKILMIVLATHGRDLEKESQLSKLKITTFPNWKGLQGKGEGLAKLWAVETGRKREERERENPNRLSLVRIR